MDRLLISPKEIIKLYNISYSKLNRLTKDGTLKVVGKEKNKRLYRLGDVEETLGGKKQRAPLLTNREPQFSHYF